MTWEEVKGRFNSAQKLSRAHAVPVVSGPLAAQIAAAHNSFLLAWMLRCNQDRPPP